MGLGLCLFPLCPLWSPWDRHCWALILFAGGQGWGEVDCGGGGKEGRGSQASATDEGLASLFLLLHAQESVSSSGTPHKRDSFIYSTWLEDSISTTSGGSSPGTGPGLAPPTGRATFLGPRQGIGLGTEGVGPSVLGLPLACDHGLVIGRVLGGMGEG